MIESLRAERQGDRSHLARGAVSSAREPRLVLRHFFEEQAGAFLLQRTYGVAETEHERLVFAAIVRRAYEVLLSV